MSPGRSLSLTVISVGKSDLLRNGSAADDRLDGAGGVKRSGRHRGDLCAQTVALRGGAGPDIVKAVVGFAVERGCSTVLGLGDTKARCVQRKRNLGAPINGSRSGCANRCFAGYGIAIRQARLPLQARRRGSGPMSEPIARREIFSCDLHPFVFVVVGSARTEPFSYMAFYHAAGNKGTGKWKIHKFFIFPLRPVSLCFLN